MNNEEQEKAYLISFDIEENLNKRGLDIEASLNLIQNDIDTNNADKKIEIMRKKIIDLLSVRFLQIRRGNFVLVLDNEMLTFLVALFTKSKKTKLDELYKLFNSYGICFNRGSRLAIEEYLLKLNLLDRKSDSGEAQYVTVVL